MLLSRIFSLLLGTTLFVMIWTMQDGDHAAPRMAVTAELRSIVRTSEEPQETAASFPVELPEVISVSSSPATSDPVLWIFADEPPTQIAVK